MEKKILRIDSADVTIFGNEVAEYCDQELQKLMHNPFIFGKALDDAYMMVDEAEELYLAMQKVFIHKLLIRPDVVKDCEETVNKVSSELDKMISEAEALKIDALTEMVKHVKEMFAKKYDEVLDR